MKRSLRLGRKAKAAATAGGDTVKTLIESFRYPRKGPGMMWEAAARKITAQGGRILMGRELVALEFDADPQSLAHRGRDGGRRAESYTARHVVTSAPVRELVERIRPTPISLLHARALRYRDFLTVALMVRKTSLFPDNWIYIHDPSVKVGRVQNFRSWSPEMVPDGMSCLGLEYFCFEGEACGTRPMTSSSRWRKRKWRRSASSPPTTWSTPASCASPRPIRSTTRTIATMSRPIRLDLEGSYRRCTWSAATACTNTTTRTTR